MEGSCEKLLALKVIKDASAFASSLSAPKSVRGDETRSTEPRSQSAGQITSKWPENHEVWGAVGGKIDADSASWRASIEQKGLMEEASRNGREEAITQLKDLLIFNPEGHYERSTPKCGASSLNVEL